MECGSLTNNNSCEIDASNRQECEDLVPTTTLSCGAEHTRIYGYSGYDTDGHWCKVNFLKINQIFLKSSLPKARADSATIEETAFIGKFTTESAENFEGPCEKMPVCNGPVCRANCDAEAGIYADSRDCRTFCECSGHRNQRNSSLKKCPQGTLFDQELKVCNHASLVDTSRCNLV